MHIQIHNGTPVESVFTVLDGALVTIRSLQLILDKTTATTTLEALGVDPIDVEKQAEEGNLLHVFLRPGSRFRTLQVFS